MEREETGQFVEGERGINLKELDPNVALRLGVQSQRRGAGSVAEAGHLCLYVLSGCRSIHGAGVHGGVYTGAVDASLCAFA